MTREGAGWAEAGSALAWRDAYTVGAALRGGTPPLQWQGRELLTTVLSEKLECFKITGRR